MTKYLITNKQTKKIIPLRVSPQHQVMPTFTTSPLNPQQATVLYGCYIMDYLLPQGDKLRIVANHDKKTTQLLLFTHDSRLIKTLPGGRPASLTADTIATLQRYCLRAHHYQQPLTSAQQQKLEVVQSSLIQLTLLLEKERVIQPHNHQQQEDLRCEILSIINQCQQQNRLIATNPTVSEGELGKILYHASKAAKQYQFNRVYAVCREDQFDFSQTEKNQQVPYFVWDSEIQLHNQQDLDDTIRIISQYYQLAPPKKLHLIHANRWLQLKHRLTQLWQESRGWVDSLANHITPHSVTQESTRLNGVTSTAIEPYYFLHGLKQEGHQNLNELVAPYFKDETVNEPFNAENHIQAKAWLATQDKAAWAIIPSSQTIILLHQKNRLIAIRYFIQNDLFYPLPDGNDLHTLCQLNKNHLLWPKRLYLTLKALMTRIPHFFIVFYQKINHFVVHQLHQELLNHIHAGHPTPDTLIPPTTPPENSMLYQTLKTTGLLPEGQSIEEFIKEHLQNSPYTIAQAKHPPSPSPYTNPIHRTIRVARHFAGFFIDTSELNPTIGLLALAAYAYGAGAIIAPTKLASLLTKLHLNGLISGIEATQKWVHFMNEGTISQTITASVMYWQGMVAGGHLDTFFIKAIQVLKDDPVDVAIIASLALGLGYGITKAIPALQEEMGVFPYTNYLTLGAKGGAAIYDTIAHPGEDWFLGTIKWLGQQMLSATKLIVAPFIESYFYGFTNGFIHGWKKSAILAKQLGQQLSAGLIDLVFELITIPLVECTALFIHVPFRGLTNLSQNILAGLGNFTAIGQSLIELSTLFKPQNYLVGFRLSPLYGFSSPMKDFHANHFLNLTINMARLLILWPLQLILNIAILPSSDLLSLTARLLFTVTAPVLNLSLYLSGTLLKTVGYFWDNSIGKIFAYSANALTRSTNWLEQQVSTGKQNLLAVITIQRRKLYDWAFGDSDLSNHHQLSDEHYFQSNPRRYALMPHHDSHWLLNHQLNQDRPLLNQKSSTITAPVHTKSLFQPQQARNETMETPLDYKPKRCIALS